MKSLLSFKLFHSRLSAKMWLNMVVPTLVILLVLLLAVSLYFNRFVLANSLQRADEETNYVASALNSSHKDLLAYFVRTTTSANFRDGLRQIADAAPEDYIVINNSLQNIFAEYLQVNKLLDSCLLASGPASGTPGMLFHSYKLRLDDDTPSYPLSDPAKQGSGLTILPCSTSPFTTRNEVIPIIIPLQYKNTTSLIAIADTLHEAHAVLYLFVSSEALTDFLELYCNDNSEGRLYLVDEEGYNVSHMPAEYHTDPELTTVLKRAIAENNTEIRFGSDFIFLSYVETMDRYLINQIPENLFETDSKNMRMTLYIIGVVSILLVSYLSMMINRHVAKPLTQLMQSLHEIENQTYQGQATTATGDEIGQLSEAIDSMSTTIRQQILTIKHEEKEKYDTQLQLLSEQINPHFLYNALEFINMEVYNHHIENASGMISSLGEYLRISLAYGDNEVLLSQELDQVTAYVKIMNYRFHNSIQVSTDIPEWLLGTKIVKCILQPLVENSLKHGFQIGSSTGFPFSPMINISMLVKDEQILLTVTDNGAGIDVEKATLIMHTKQAGNAPDRHFGLNNVYQRLRSCYGEVSVEFSSIPYFENNVTITLPASFFT